MLPNYVLYYAIEFWQKNKYSSECEVGIRETNGYCIDRRGELNGGGYFAVTWMQTKKVANNIYFTGGRWIVMGELLLVGIVFL